MIYTEWRVVFSVFIPEMKHLEQKKEYGTFIWITQFEYFMKNYKDVRKAYTKFTTRADWRTHSLCVLYKAKSWKTGFLSASVHSKQSGSMKQYALCELLLIPPPQKKTLTDYRGHAIIYEKVMCIPCENLHCLRASLKPSHKLRSV